MASWDQSEARVNESVFRRYGKTCTYIPKAGISFPLRYLLHDGPVDQPVSPAFFADLEVMASELGTGRDRGDQVDIDGKRYVVNRILARALRNPVVTLHAMKDDQ